MDWVARRITGNLASDLRDSRAVKDGVERALRVRAEAIASQMRISFDEDMFSQLAADYARIHAYERGVLEAISETNRELLGSALQRAIEQGQTYEEARRYVADWFEDLEDYETYRIAATEVAQASRYANLKTTQDLSAEYGIEIERCIWDAATDACEDCLARDAESRSVEPPWTVEQAMAMGDLHPQDRCDWIYEVADVEP